jgi:anti-sigma factor RsiW
MSTHLSREQMVKYRDRELLPGELVAIDGHLGKCEHCRGELAALATSSFSLTSAIRQSRFDHISYEQMDAWVDDELDQTQRELVLSHIGLCQPCARQLKAYESYAPVMSAPIVVQPAQPISLADKIRAWFQAPQLAMAAAAVLAIAILGPLVMRESSRGLGRDIAQFDSLPDSVRNSAKEVVRDNPAGRPASLAGLAPNADSNLQYPVSEVIEERQPILRWKSFGGSYAVSLYDASHRQIAQRGNLTDTHWLVPAPLDRGETYTWEIASAGETRRASFRVLGDDDQAKLQEVRASKVGPLALGAVAQQLGLLSLAEREFEALTKEKPKSQDAVKLLDHVIEMRGR